MFYSVFYMPKANFSLRDESRLKIVGYLVKMGRRFLTVQPSKHPVVVQGKKQFWFNYGDHSVLAIQGRDGCWYAKTN